MRERLVYKIIVRHGQTATVSRLTFNDLFITSTVHFSHDRSEEQQLRRPEDHRRRRRRRLARLPRPERQRHDRTPLPAQPRPDHPRTHQCLHLLHRQRVPHHPVLGALQKPPQLPHRPHPAHLPGTARHRPPLRLRDGPTRQQSRPGRLPRHRRSTPIRGQHAPPVPTGARPARRLHGRAVRQHRERAALDAAVRVQLLPRRRRPRRDRPAEEVDGPDPAAARHRPPARPAAPLHPHGRTGILQVLRGRHDPARLSGHGAAARPPVRRECRRAGHHPRLRILQHRLRVRWRLRRVLAGVQPHHSSPGRRAVRRPELRHVHLRLARPAAPDHPLARHDLVGERGRALAITLALAYLSWHLVEKRSLRAKRYLVARRSSPKRPANL